MTDPILCFKSVVSFLADLNDAFGHIHSSLRLLFKNVEQITFTQPDKIEIYNKLFETFCTVNREAILARAAGQIKDARVAASEKAYVDMAAIFAAASPDQATCIWAHLLTLLALFDSSERQRCAQLVDTFRQPSGIIGDIIKKIEKEVSGADASNPVELVSKIMQSGTFSEIVSELTASVERGDVDLNKLANGVGFPMT